MRAYHRTLILAIAGLAIGAALGACSPNFPTGTIEIRDRSMGSDGGHGSRLL